MREDQGYKAKSNSLPEIEFNNVKVPVLKRKETFVYLGKPLTVAGETEEVLIEMLNDYGDLLNLISESVAPNAIKIEALETIALSKISHRFSNMHITETGLYKLDQLLVLAIRKIFNLTHSTTTKTCFQPKVRGGLGIRKPSIVYRTTRIAHLIKMLNHNEDNIRFLARNSLVLDMYKRGVSRANNDFNFLGFKCKEDNQLDTHITGGFGLISDWPHLHYLATKAGLQVIWEKNTEDLIDSGSVRVFVKENGRELFMVTLRKEIQYTLLNRELKWLLELKMQGRLIDLKTCDYLLFQDIFKNAIWSDDL